MLKGGNKECLWSPIHLTSAEIRVHPLSIQGKKNQPQSSSFCVDNSSRILWRDNYSAAWLFCCWYSIGCLGFHLPCVKWLLVVSSPCIQWAEHSEKELNCQDILLLFNLIGLCNSLRAFLVYWCFIEVVDYEQGSRSVNKNKHIHTYTQNPNYSMILCIKGFCFSSEITVINLYCMPAFETGTTCWLMWAWGCPRARSCVLRFALELLSHWPYSIVSIISSFLACGLGAVSWHFLKLEVVTCILPLSYRKLHY